MKKLTDAPLYETLVKIGTLDKTPMTIEQGLRHLMFMQAVLDEISWTGSPIMDLNKIEEIALEHSGCDKLSMGQLIMYLSLADLTYHLLKE